MKITARRPLNFGLTLVEMVVTIALMAILVALTTPYLLGSREKALLNSEVDKFTSTLEFAKQQSIAAFHGQTYSVLIEPESKYTLLPDNKIYIMDNVNFSQPTTPLTISFDILTGKPNLASDFILTSARFYTIVSINDEGLITSSEVKRK